MNAHRFTGAEMSDTGRQPSFWVDLGERTLLTFVQAFVGAISVGGAASTGHPFLNLPWELATEVGGVAALMCFLTGLGSLRVGSPQTASFLPPAEHINAFFAARKDH